MELGLGIRYSNSQVSTEAGITKEGGFALGQSQEAYKSYRHASLLPVLLQKQQPVLVMKNLNEIFNEQHVILHLTTVKSGFC